MKETTKPIWFVIPALIHIMVLHIFFSWKWCCCPYDAHSIICYLSCLMHQLKSQCKIS